ncbi:sulfite oxidase [Thioploca ingrica]|uniref:Protein-methionine-sulfoxide reductase heme-binding subunit MsrQ n=1 Tax=Thioploca ingrica TaxID=40754 RepID=A0A090AP76_9GAMM|nr:sulfite oxidase [Thioploca ingrica]
MPLIFLIVGLVTEHLGANPAEMIIHETGQWALRLLMLTLSITPLVQITGWSILTVRYNLRRLLGLYAFFYASLHLLSYLLLEQNFAWQEIMDDILTHPALDIGWLAFILMIPLAMTSYPQLAHQLSRRRWQQLHQLIYLISISAIIHFGWLAQAKVDVREPLIYAAILLMLLLLRYPPVIRRLAHKNVTFSKE